MKKVLALVLFVALVLMLPSCGNDVEDTKEKSTEATEATRIDDVADTELTQTEPSENKDKSDPENPTDITSSEIPTDTVTVPEDLSASYGLEFKSNGDGTCSIVGIGICDDTELVIPNKSPDGDTVVLIEENAFYSLDDVNSVTFLNCSFEIDERAFQYSEFEVVKFVGGAPVLGKSAFSSCEDITSLTFEKCNVEIGEYAFYSCGNDSTVYFKDCGGLIDERAFQYGDFTEVTFERCELKFEDSAFSSCENISAVTFLESTVELGEYAFYCCGDSANVEFKNCSVTMDERVFQYSSLDTVSVSGSMFEADKSVFSSCEDLSSVSIDCDSVKLGEYTFYDCKDLTSIEICNNENDEQKVVLDDRVFQYCENLTSVVIGSSNVEIGKYAFGECSDELNVTIAGIDYSSDELRNGYPVKK